MEIAERFEEGISIHALVKRATWDDEVFNTACLLFQSTPS